MRLNYILKSGYSERLILIFGGWGIAPAFYGGISRDGWDLAVVTDYDDMDARSSGMTELKGLADRYHTIYLYAWSFGVKVAEAILPKGFATRAFAIAGTPQGVDDRYGISEKIFNATRDTLNARNMEKFLNRVFSGHHGEERRKLIEKSIGTEAEDEKSEERIERLRRQLDNIVGLVEGTPLNWDRVYIPGSDLIIPTQAQRSAWESRGCATVEIPDAGHYPGLEEIVRETIINTNHIAESFSKALPTYSSSATPQHSFAESLVRMIENSGIAPHRILEIGNGAGTFTRMLARLYPKAFVTLVDLYLTPMVFKFAMEEYLVADAEKWIVDCPYRFDLICSSSALQWFVNLPAFLKHAASCLTDRGVLAVSLLTRGTLRELDSVRRSRLHYYEPEELRQMALELFDEVEVEEERVEIEFGSAREALLHIGRTGVNAGPVIPLGEALKALRGRKLTYVSTRLLCSGKKAQEEEEVEMDEELRKIFEDLEKEGVVEN